MPAHQPLTPRVLALLCLASAAWAFSFGLGAPLASLWLQDAGYSDSVIGLNTGTYYFGIAAAAGLVPWALGRWGRASPAAGMVASALTVAAFPWGGSPAGWFALRLGNGVGAALSLISLESYVNRRSPPGQRARNFGVYAFSVALGWALGNLVGLELYPIAARLAFALGGAGALLGAACTARLPWPGEPAEERGRHGPVGLLRNFGSFAGAWCQGFLEGGMVAFLPVYCLFLGMPEGRVAWLTSAIMVGVIVTQVPIAWLADRVGRTAVLVSCYGAAMAGLLLLPFCGDSPWLAGGLFVVAACSGAFYPVGLAILGDRLPGSALARANAWFLGINCCGSLVGPVVTGVVMDWCGKRAMFGSGAAALAVALAAWAVLGRSGNGRAAPAALESRDAA